MIDRQAARDFLHYRLGDGLQNKRTLLMTLDSPFLDSAYVFPYLGILYLLSVARSSGLPVNYLDEKKLAALDQECNTPNVAYTDKFQHGDLSCYAGFDAIGISCMTPQGGQAYEICRAIKRAYPEKTVILGGPHARFYLQECLEQPFDLIVAGDGERIFSDMITGDIARLADKATCLTPQTLVLEDTLSAKEMNRFPIPFRQRSYLNQYRYFLEGVPATTLVNSRGCPMSCFFCEHRNTLPKWYCPAHFAAEVRDIVSCGFNAVMIFDDLFAIHPARLSPYLDTLRHYHHANGFIFRCFGHAHIISKYPQLLDRLSEAGCVEIGIGAESASQDILDNAGKKTTVSQLHACINEAARRGIKVKAFFMIGLPGETERTFGMTHDFIKMYRRKYPGQFDFDLSVFFPYRGTLIGDALRLKPGQAVDRAKGVPLNHTSFGLRLNPEYTWRMIDSGVMGAYKKRRGASDLVIESYDWKTKKVLLSGGQIQALRERTMSYSGRYAEAELVEGNIGPFGIKSKIRKIA